jgi:hypothetical protein
MRMGGLVLGLSISGLVGVGAPSQASGLFLKKAIKKVKQTVSKATKKVEEGAKKAKDAIVGGAKDAAGKVKETGTQALAWMGKRVQEFKSLFKDAIWNWIKEQIISRLTGAKSHMEPYVLRAIDAVKREKDRVGQWIKKANDYFDQVRQTITSGFTKFKNLLGETGWQLKLVQMFKNLINRDFGDDMKKLVRELAQKIGLMSTKTASLMQRRESQALCSTKDWPAVPFAKHFPKSFQLTLTGSLGGYSPKIVGGAVNLAFGLVADLGKEAGKEYDVRGIVSIGLGVGGGVPGPDASVGLVLALSPLRASDAAGGYVTLSAGGNTPKIVGGTVGVAWGPGSDGKWPAIPEISAGITAGAPGASATIGGGWSFTFTKDTFNPM